MEEFLKFMEKYVKVSPIEWYFIRKRLKPVVFEKNSLICRQGDVCERVVFVKSGLARAYYLSSKGKDFTINFLYDDEAMTPMTRFASDYDSFIHQKPARFSIEVVEELHGWEMDYASTNWLFERSTKMQQFARMSVEETLSFLVQGIIEFLEYDPKERFELFSQRHPSLIDRIPQYHIATYLGITPQHLSRLKSEQKKGKKSA